MPTTIDSAGITFNDATSLTSANIGTAQLVNGSVTAAKLGTTEQKQIAKAWVNFNGAAITSGNASSFNTISCNSGATTGTFTAAGWSSADIGTIYKITQINGVVGGTLGGVNVSTLGVQVMSVVAGVSATFTFLSGTTTSAQSVTGTGSSSSGFSFSTSGIRSSYNVSSVTKNGTGDYTVNFASAMADANYSISGLSIAGSNGTRITYLTYNSLSTPSANSIRLSNYPSGDGTGAYADTNLICVQVFGN